MINRRTLVLTTLLLAGSLPVSAAQVLKVAASAIPQRTGIERFLPKLKQCAVRISTSFLEQQAERQDKGAPERAA